MDLKIPYANLTNSDEAFNKACEIITPSYVQKFQVKVDIKQEPAKKCISADGKGFNLTLKFTETECLVSLNLSLMLKPLKGKILSKIERELEKYM